MRVLGLIPARGGSKGIPGKNIKLLGGKPLINYTIEQALYAKALSTVMVSTEDQGIERIATAAGASVPFMRSALLAADETPTVDVVLSVLHDYERLDIFFDAICLLQPTSPFRSTQLIEDAVEKFVNCEADSLISVRSVPHELNPHWVFEPDATNEFLRLATGEECIIARRQDLPPAYYRDGALYLVRTSVLKKSGSLYGSKIAYIVNGNLPYVNLDTIEDWHRAERILDESRQESA